MGKANQYLADYLSRRPRYVKVLIALGMLKYRLLTGSDECLIRRSWRWWNPLVWFFLVATIAVLLAAHILACPWVLLFVCSKFTKKLIKPRVVECIAIENMED